MCCEVVGVVNVVEWHLHEDANPGAGCTHFRLAVVHRAEDVFGLDVLALLDAEAHLVVLVAQTHDLATVLVAVLAVDLQTTND